MNVLLLGVGAIGSVISHHLAAHRAVAGLTLCDRDTRRAESLAGEVGPGRVRVMALDAADPAALRRAFHGAGLVINAVLPRFNVGIMDAALEAGCQYLDLCSGEEDQFTRHAAWRAAGRTALHDMGEDPGISNILARLSADRLDAVEAIRVRDGEFSLSDDIPLACLFSTETFIEEAVSGARVYADGVWKELPPWSGRELYPFPPPVGPQPVYCMSHEEVHSLPRFIGKWLRRVDFKLAVPDDMQTQLAFLDRIGMTRRDEVRISTPGVLAPEQIEPQPMLALLAELGVQVEETTRVVLG